MILADFEKYFAAYLADRNAAYSTVTKNPEQLSHA
jgi:hypothetical protein